MTLIKILLNDAKAEVDAALERLLPSPESPPRELHEAIRWSVFGGGKRIRPAILFAVGETLGVSQARLVNAAAAVEMIHTYSLIHDDLPSMDDDDLRRGRASCHKQFGEATAILAGDALQALAFQTIAEDKSLSFENRSRIIAILARAAGTPIGMVAGQQLDLTAESRQISTADLDQIHSRKTGALIKAAAVSGSVIADATDEETDAVSRFADRLGLLFQITDDLIDATQTTETLGKTAGKDAASSKATYAALHGIDRARLHASEVRNQALAELDTIPRATGLLRELADLILDRSR